MFRRIGILLLALAMIAANALAEAEFAAVADVNEAKELSALYGRNIADAAAEVGGLSYKSGDEFDDNYENDCVALRGRGGAVALIELKAGKGPYALCGVRTGMARGDAMALFTGYTLLWEYDEEVAFTIVENKQDEIESLTLVIFFDEDGRVNGAWYRNAEA